MVNYNNGKIYKIEPKCEHEEGDVYIGSTTKNYLSQRMNNHRSMYKRWKNEKVNKHVRSYDLFDKYGLENCEIILVEIVNCETKEQLHAREKYYIKSMQCVNKTIPLRTSTEYYESIKDKKIEYNKTRYSENAVVREKILEQNKKYQIRNQEAIADKKKLYRENNKEAIKLKKQENETCECGCEVRKDKLPRHQRTKKHEQLMKEKAEI